MGRMMFRRILKSLILEPPVRDTVESIRKFDIPENDGIFRQLPRWFPTYSYANQIKKVPGHAAIAREIYGHPDMHDYLWHRAGADITPEARWIIRGAAAFAHPVTKIIFAINTGFIADIQIRIPISATDDFPGIQILDNRAATGSCVWIRSRLIEEEDKQLLKLAYVAAS
jgi:hypothetical protein